MSLQDISRLEGIFNLNTFLNNYDYLVSAWNNYGVMEIADWVDITNPQVINTIDLSPLFYENQVSITIFPWSIENEKVVFNDYDDFNSHIEKEEEYRVVPYVIYTPSVMLIFEPDMEIIIKVASEQTKIEQLKLGSINHSEYLSKIHRLKEDGLL